MSAWASIGSVFNSASVGRGWQPKQGRIRVGRDVGAYTATTFSGENSRNTVIGNADDVALKSDGLFQDARWRTQSGGRALSFRNASQAGESGSTAGVSIVSGQGEDLKLGNLPLVAQKGDYAIAYNSSGGKNEILILKKEAGTGKYALSRTVAADKDMKISWGGEGEPVILSGGAALTNGKLVAGGEDEFLFRHSKADVVAGKNTTVLNMSAAAGNYSGGDNVTFLGSYQGGTFSDISGKVDFAGYFKEAGFSNITGKSSFSGVFEGVAVAMEKGDAAFSGYFSASSISAGEKDDAFSGLFLNKCAIRGGAGNDRFSGRFIGSEVDGGKGDDSFGDPGSMSRRESLSYAKGKKAYEGLAADFINSTINAGEGDDAFKGVMSGGTLNLDQGRNAVNGIFEDATVNGGENDDSISALYSRTSTFNTGLGNDIIDLTTSVQSTVNTDEGENRISLGKNNAVPGSKTWQNRDDYFSKERPAETGELQHNVVNAEKGDNAVAVHNGESTAAFLNGTVYEEKEAGESAAAEAGAPTEAGVPAESGVPAEEAAAPAARTASAESLGQVLVREIVNNSGADSPETGKASADMAARGGKIRRAALGRYGNVYGVGPLDAAIAPAVTVNNGPGESHEFEGVKRFNQFEEIKEQPGMIRVIRRYNEVSGSFSSRRWEKIKN